MLTEIEVKCMDVYQNENASSKYTSQRANATMSVSGNIVVIVIWRMYLPNCFKKTKYPVIKASDGILISTVSLMDTKKYAILSR